MVGSEEPSPQGGHTVSTINNNRFDPNSFLGNQVGRGGSEAFSIPSEARAEQPVAAPKTVMPAPQAPIVANMPKSALPPLVGGRPSLFGSSVIGSPVANSAPAGIVPKKSASAESAPTSYAQYAAGAGADEINAFLKAPSEIKIQ
jgi:hypothetical protein